MKLQFTGFSGIMVSTVKRPYTKGYETVVFNENGDEILCRLYTNKVDAIIGHNKYARRYGATNLILKGIV